MKELRKSMRQSEWKRSAALFGVVCTAFAAMSAAGDGRPKNVIFMIADGCGYGQIAATDLYESGSTGVQSYEDFPVRAAMSTGSLNTGGYDPAAADSIFNSVMSRAMTPRKPTDSAAAATALSTGVKTLNGELGMNPAGLPLENIVERFEKLGKSTGVVTSVPFAHATPAGFVIHAEDRGSLTGIADRMLSASPLEVLMGCGHPLFDRQGLPSGTPDFRMVGGQDVWDSLMQGKCGADRDGDGDPDPWTFIDDRETFRSLATGPAPERLFGLARTFETLQQGRGGRPQAPPDSVPPVETVPTLTEMTSAALNVLDGNPDGFFLMVEAGAVDWASHDNQTGRMIEEMTDFNRAVDRVLAWVEVNGGWERTLVIVTGDHETGRPVSPSADSLWSRTPSREKAALLNPVGRGRGITPDLVWCTVKHTNALLPLFAKGAGSELLKKSATGTDPVRGPYLDNTDVAAVIFRLNPLPN
jgi:alkaline phosphatase